MRRSRFWSRAFVALGAVVAVGVPARAEIIYGMTGTSSGEVPGLNLVSFDSATPGTVTTVGAFSGVVAGHGLRSMDFRPSTGQLYAISSNVGAAQLYTVDLLTAALTPVGPGFTLGTNTFTSVEMDFNPVSEAIRVVTAASGTSAQTNNFRLSAATGMLLGTDPNLAFAPGDPRAGNAVYNIVAAAYANNNFNTPPTTLYAWDYQSDSLVTIGNVNGTPNGPNTGLMFTVNTPPGFLTFNAGIGMDISGATNILYVTHDDPATGTMMSLFTRDLTTGAEASVGLYPAGTFITDIAVQPVPIPEPTSMALCGVAVAGFAVRAWRKRKA